MSFENENDRTSHAEYYLPKVEIKDYNVMVDGKNFFDQSINNDFKTYENIRKIATGKGDDYTTGCLLDYHYFEEKCKMIVINLRKQQAWDADPRTIQQINVTSNLDRAGNTTMFFIIEKAKEIVLDFSQGTVKICECNFIEMCYWMQLNDLVFYQYKMRQYDSLNVSEKNINIFFTQVHFTHQAFCRGRVKLIGYQWCAN